MLCRFVILCRDLSFLKKRWSTFWPTKFEYCVQEQMNEHIEVIFTELKLNIHVVLVFIDI